MDKSAVVEFITKTFPDVETTYAYGYDMFFYKSDRKLSFVTLIDSDYDYDRVSDLNRPGVFRLNIGVSKQTFESLFGKMKSISTPMISLPWMSSCPIRSTRNTTSSVCVRQVKIHLEEYVLCS